MTATTVAPSDVGRPCPYCRFPLKGETTAERCDSCQALHHADCWQDGGGCAVLGCATMAPAQEPNGKGAILHAPPPPPPPPSLAPAPARAPGPPATGDRPPRHGVLIGVIACLAIAIAAVAGFLIVGGSHKASTGSTPSGPTTPVVTPDAQTVPTPTAQPPAPTTNHEGEIARKIAAIVTFSQEGRTAVRAGRYSDAITNRRSVLKRLRALSGASGRLASARNTLERAMEASLQSDESYAAGEDASSSDSEATRLKAVFARQWAPVADAHGLAQYSEGDF